jgi:hypothetical protein
MKSMGDGGEDREGKKDDGYFPKHAGCWAPRCVSTSKMKKKLGLSPLRS